MKINVTYIPTGTRTMEDGEFYCEHENTHYEIVEVDTMRDGEHDTYNSEIEICDDCDAEVDDDR